VCAAAVAVLLLAGLAAWHWWPQQVAPELTSQMVKAIDSSGNRITLIDGGSKRDAHILWQRYHDRPAYGTPPKSPRLLGVSLVKLKTDSFPGSGTYWAVYSDRVWEVPSIGEGSFGREVSFFDPETLRGVMAMDF
jgi:hypothetical protein